MEAPAPYCPLDTPLCVCTRTNLDDTDERRCDREVGSRRADRHRRRRRFPSHRRRDRPARPGPARSLSVPVDDDKPPCWSGRRVTKWYVEPDTKRHDLELRREIGNNGKTELLLSYRRVLAWLSVWARCRLAYGPADATTTHCLLLR